MDSETVDMLVRDSMHWRERPSWSGFYPCLLHRLKMRPAIEVMWHDIMASAPNRL
jgi:hypothetical protein